MAGEPGDNFSGKIDGMPLPDVGSELQSAFDVSVPSSRASPSTPAPSEMLSSSSAPSEEDEIPDQDVEMVPAPSEMLSSSSASSSLSAPSEEDEIPDQDLEMVSAPSEILTSSCAFAFKPAPSESSSSSAQSEGDGISDQDVEMVPDPAGSLTSSSASSSSSAQSEEDEISDQDVEMVPDPAGSLTSSCAFAFTPGPSEMLSSSSAQSEEEDEIPGQDVEMVPAPAGSIISSCDSASTLFIEYESHQHEFLPPIEFSPIELEEVFSEFKARQDGILKALTTDFKSFCRLCDDPEKDNLCLYGLGDGTWEVKVPPDEVPPDMPEPITGINIWRRGSMEEKQWRSFIAAHSDAWLLAHTFLLGALSGFGQESRETLFEMMSDLPTIYVVVTGVDNEPTNEGTPNNSSESNKSPSQPSIPDGESSTGDK